MKVGIIYTSTTPESVKSINTEVRKQLGDKVEILNYQDSSILEEVCERGHVTVSAAARLVSLFMQAINDGADAMLSCCSSVGEVVDTLQDFMYYTGIPIIKIDEEMCWEAVRLGNRIGILATLPTTMEPTKNALLHAACDMNCQVMLVEGYMEGAFGVDRDTFQKRICDKAAEIIDQVDVLLLAQASMAYMEEILAERFKKPVLSSSRFGAASLAKALEAKKIQ